MIKKCWFQILGCFLIICFYLNVEPLSLFYVEKANNIFEGGNAISAFEKASFHPVFFLEERKEEGYWLEEDDRISTLPCAYPTQKEKKKRQGSCMSMFLVEYCILQIYCVVALPPPRCHYWDYEEIMALLFVLKTSQMMLAEQFITIIIWDVC